MFVYHHFCKIGCYVFGWQGDMSLGLAGCVYEVEVENETTRVSLRRVHVNGRTTGYAKGRATTDARFATIFLRDLQRCVLCDEIFSYLCAL